MSFETKRDELQNGDWTRNDRNSDAEIRRRVILGTASNFAGQIFAFATALLLTPFILQQLGPTVYGIWVLLGSVVAYGALLDFGLWGTIIKYVAEYTAQENYALARRMLSTALSLYLGVGILISIAGIALAEVLPQLFNLPAEQRDLAQILVVLMSLSTGLALPCMIPLAILRGLQRYELVNIIDVLTTCVTAIGTVIVLLRGGAVALVLVNLTGLFVMFATGLWTIRRVAPDLVFRWNALDRQMFRRLLSYSWPLFMRDVSLRLQTRTDEITIAIFLPVSMVGSYNIARRLSEATQTLARQFMKTLLPLASQLQAEDDLHRFRAVFKTGTRLTLVLILGLGAVVIVLAKPLLTVWIDSSYARYAGVAIILTLAHVFATVQWIASVMLQASSKHRILAFSSLGAGLANLILSVALVRPLGLIGVALGTLIPAALEYTLVILPRSLHITGIGKQEAWEGILAPGLLTTVPTIVTLHLLNIVVEPDSIGEIAIVTAIGLVIHGLVYMGIGAHRLERAKYLAMIRHLFGVIRPYVDQHREHSA